MTDGVPAGSIEIRVERVSQLFDSLDPLPFPNRDLANAAEDYIVTWARELSRQEPITIAVHLPRAESDDQIEQLLGNAFAEYFRGRVEYAGFELKELFRIGRISLLIGMVILGSCLGIGQLFQDRLGDRFVGQFIYEGFILVGWVANWRPLEIFLYDWWPIVRRQNLYRRLSKATVVVKQV